MEEWRTGLADIVYSKSVARQFHAFSIINTRQKGFSKTESEKQPSSLFVSTLKPHFSSSRTGKVISLVISRYRYRRSSRRYWDLSFAFHRCWAGYWGSHSGNLIQLPMRFMHNTWLHLYQVEVHLQPSIICDHVKPAGSAAWEPSFWFVWKLITFFPAEPKFSLNKIVFRCFVLVKH